MTFGLLAALLGAIALGFFLGFWRGESVSGRKAVDYWLTATDQRVNWSRVTAAVGLASFAALETAFIHVYLEKNGEGLTEALLIMATATLGLAGINLGQYIVSKRPTAPPPDTITTTDERERTSKITVTS